MLLLALAGCSEYIPFGGGALDGEPAAAPADISSIAEIDIIQLETRGDDGPYSVNLWVAEVDGYLHVFAGDTRSTWVEHIEGDPRVRLGAGQYVYSFTATRIADPEIFERFAKAWKEKYGNRPVNENVTETYLFRLTSEMQRQG